MCDHCSRNSLDRRTFLVASSALGMGGMLAGLAAGEEPAAGDGLAPPLTPREKTPARVLAAFLYPPAEVVNAGQLEDSWRPHHWFTWPGNQFQPEAQHARFAERIREMADRLGIAVEFAPQAIYQEAKVREFIEKAKANPPDAVLIVNFWNTFAKWSHEMATQSAPAAIVYQPVGSNHQLPPAFLREAEGLYYIHSIENFEEIERGLRAVRAAKMLGQSRLLRVSGGTAAPRQQPQRPLGVEVLGVPAEEFNRLFDSVEADDALVREAMEFRKRAVRVMDVADEYFVEAYRAHRAVGEILRRYAADAITIECLMLKHRKPCVSFAINNGALIPCGCENHLDGTITMMLGRWLLDRAGFMHNPEFDTSDNLYFGAHCTCAWKLHGPEGPAQEYLVRPFFHQLPKTVALDVQWTPGEPIMVAKYLCGENALSCWTGKVIHSPTSPPTGGCATRVLMEIDRVDDVCEIYRGPHPILFCGDRGDARRWKAFSRMYGVKLEGNV